MRSAFPNLNARTLNSEKVNELHVTVATHDVSIVRVGKTCFKDYMNSSSLPMQWIRLKRKYRSLGRAGSIACYIKMI